MSTRTSNLSRSSPRKLQTSRPKKDYTEDEVKTLLHSTASSGRRVSDAVIPLLAACSSAVSAQQAQQLRRVIFETCIESLNTHNLQTQDAKELIGKLLFEVDVLEGESLVTLAELLIKGVKTGKHQALDLFPKLLAVIASKKIIEYRKDNGTRGEMGGAAQKGHLLNSLCGCRWEEEEGCVQHIAHMCQEIPMNSEELEFLIDKILRVMKGLKVMELPPLVYQLLVLSVKGHQATVLNGIRALFSHLDEEVLENSEPEEDSVVSRSSSRRELLQTEGTVILHITNALKQDQELRKVFTKSLKVSQSCLSPGTLSLFNLALMLSLARIHTFEEPVFTFMKEIVLRNYKEQERVESSLWMQEMYQDIPSLEDLLLDLVDHSVGGWDHVVSGIFLVGFQLMELFGSKSAFSSQGPQYKACCLGSKILYHTFKVHVMVRQELVTQLVNRILSNASTFADHYTELLGSLVEHYHQAALESLPKLKEAFSSLCLLPPQPALQLLHAVMPLVKYNVSLRDCLLLVLRKSLFSRQMEPRKIAVAAYLMLLKKFTVLDALGIESQGTESSQNGSQSQVTVEVHGAGPSSGGHTGLCLEILGVLRRALTKQYDVRLSLYEGLCAVFYTNTKLAEPIMDLLWGQFELYYEPGQDTLPPLTIPTCLSVGDTGTALLEPLDSLLQSMQLCVFKYWEWKDKLEERMEEAGQEVEPPETPEVILMAKEVLESVVERMVKSEPEDFELDKSSDFSLGTSVGQKNRVVARLVMNIYETLLEFTFAMGEYSQASVEQTLKLFQSHRRVADILQDGGGAGAKKGGGASAAAKSNFTLQFVVRLLKALFSDTNPNHQQPLKLLRDNIVFCKYMVNVAVVKSHQIQEKGTCDGAFADFKPNKLFKLCCLLARIFFQQVETAPSHHAAKKDKGKSVSVLCLEGLSSLLHSAVSMYGDELMHGAPSQRGVANHTSSTMNLTLDNFLSAVNTSLETSSGSERLHFFIRLFQRLISAVLDSSVKDWGLKEVLVMVNLIGLLAGQLQRGSTELVAVFDWTNSQCKEQNIGDSHVTKALVSLLLTLSARLKSSVKILVRLSLDVHYHLGDVDEDVELESSPHYAIVSRDTAPNGILPLLYSHFELVLGDADWLAARLKTSLASDPMEDILEQEATSSSTNNKTCSTLCTRLTRVVSGLNELVQTLLTTSPNISGLMKLITKFFTVMGNLTKYCLAAYQRTSFIAPEFKSLVNAVGAHLSQQVYSFLTYIQTPQMQSGMGGGGGGASKKGKGKQTKGKPSVAGGEKARIRRETRSFPSLIFAMEQFEKLLIQLGKKAKENLMEGFKRSLARDFRINLEAMENEEEGEEEVDEGGESDGGQSGEDNDAQPPPAKRHKLS